MSLTDTQLVDVIYHNWFTRLEGYIITEENVKPIDIFFNLDAQQ